MVFLKKRLERPFRLSQSFPNLCTLLAFSGLHRFIKETQFAFQLARNSLTLASNSIGQINSIHCWNLFFSIYNRNFSELQWAMFSLQCLYHFVFSKSCDVSQCIRYRRFRQEWILWSVRLPFFVPA